MNHKHYPYFFASLIPCLMMQLCLRASAPDVEHIATLCELKRTPTMLDGREMTFTAKYVNAHPHGSYLQDLNCPKDILRMWVAAHADPSVNDLYLAGPKPPLITTKGRLRLLPKDHHYLFEVLSVSGLEKLRPPAATPVMTPLGHRSSFAAVIPERRYSMLYVFGDSYSDSGAGYVDGNGPTAVVYLAQHLGIPFTYYGDADSKGKGLNFAVSGARTGEGEGKHYPHSELLSLGMRNQVDSFASLVKAGTVRFDPKATMFYLAGGLNDRSLPDGATVANLQGDIEVLYAAGARRFEVALLPTKIPSFATAGERFNPLLATIPSVMFAKHPDIVITNSKWGMFFDEVMTHPATYGITDTTSKCAGRVLRDEDPTPCASPQTHFFYHEGHPSTAVHKAVADMLYDEAKAQSAAPGAPRMP